MTTYDDIILTQVDPKQSSLTAWAHEVGIIMCDGKITDMFEEGRRSIPREPLRRGGVRTFIAYMSPFDLVYWLKDPHDPSEQDRIALDNLVLTSDGEPVTGRIVITFSVMSGMVDLLLRLLGPSDAITKADVAYAIKDEVQAKVLALNLHRYTTAELRSNEDLLKSIHYSLKGDLALTISGYGLQLDSFSINWGLTLEARDRIKRQRHDSSVQDAIRAKELREVSSPNPAPTTTPECRVMAESDAQPKRRLPDDHKRLQTPTGRSVGYWVYEDDVTDNARVHKGTCGFCNHGRGIRGTRRSDNRWIGPFETESEAHRQALRTGRSGVRGCKVCL